MSHPIRPSGSRKGTYPMLSLTGTKHLHRVLDAHFAVEKQKFICEEKRALDGGRDGALNVVPSFVGLDALQSAVAAEDAQYLVGSGGHALLSHLSLRCSDHHKTVSLQQDEKETTSSAAGVLYSMTMSHLFDRRLLRRAGDRGDRVVVASSAQDMSGVALKRDWERLKKELLRSNGGDCSTPPDGGLGGVWFGQQLSNPATGRSHYVVRNRWPPGTCPQQDTLSNEGESPLPPQFQPFFPSPSSTKEGGPIGMLQPVVLSAAQEDMGSMAQLFLATDDNELQYLVDSNSDKRRRLSRLVGMLPPVLSSLMATEIESCERELHFRDQLVRLLTILFRRFMVPATTQHWSHLLNAFLLSNHNPDTSIVKVITVEEAQFLLEFILERISLLEANPAASTATPFSIEHQEELLQVASDLRTMFPTMSQPVLFAPSLLPTSVGPSLNRDSSSSQCGTSSTTNATMVDPVVASETNAEAVRRMITKNAAQLEVLPPNMQLKRVAEFVKGRAVEDRMQEVRMGLLNPCRVLLRSILGLYATTSPSCTSPPSRPSLHWAQRSLLLLGTYQSVRSGYYTWPTVAYLQRFSVTLEQIPNTKLTPVDDSATAMPPSPDSKSPSASVTKERLSRFTEALILASGYPSDAPPPPVGNSNGSGSRPQSTLSKQSPATGRIKGNATPPPSNPVAPYFHYIPKTDFTTVEALTAWGMCTGAVDPPQLSPLCLTSLLSDLSPQSPPTSYCAMVDELIAWSTPLNDHSTTTDTGGGDGLVTNPSISPESATLAATPAQPSKAATVGGQVGGAKSKGKEGGGSVGGGGGGGVAPSELQQIAAAIRGIMVAVPSRPKRRDPSAYLTRGVGDPFETYSKGGCETSLVELIDLLHGHPTKATEAAAIAPTAAAPLMGATGPKRSKSEVSKEHVGITSSSTGPSDGSLSPRSAASALSPLTNIATDSVLRRPFTAALLSSLTAVMDVVGHPSYNPATQTSRLGEVPPPLFSLVAPLLQLREAGGATSAPILPPRRRHVLSSRLQGATDAGLSSKTGYWLACELLGHSSNFVVSPTPEGTPGGEVSLLSLLSTPVKNPPATPLPAGCPSLGMLGELVGLTSLPNSTRIESQACLLQLLAQISCVGEEEATEGILEGLAASPSALAEDPSFVDTLRLLLQNVQRLKHSTPNVSKEDGSSVAGSSHERLRILNDSIGRVCEGWEGTTTRRVSTNSNGLNPETLFGLLLPPGCTTTTTTSSPPPPPPPPPIPTTTEEGADNKPTPAEMLAKALPETILAATPPAIRVSLAAIFTPIAALQSELIVKAVQDYISDAESNNNNSSPSSPIATAAPPTKPTAASQHGGSTVSAAAVVDQTPSPSALLKDSLTQSVITLQRRLLLLLLQSQRPAITPTPREVVAISVVQVIKSHAEAASENLKRLRSGLVTDPRHQAQCLLSLTQGINAVLLTLQVYWRAIAMEIASSTTLRLGRCFAMNQY